MKIKEIHVSNYCSFGNEAWISFSSNIMALIGRNGVGKTNALDAISRMRFFCDDVESVIPDRAINQNTRKVPVLKIHAILDDVDISELNAAGMGTEGDRNVAYVFTYDDATRRTRLSFSGMFISIMQNSPELSKIRQDIAELVVDISKMKNWSHHQQYRDLFEMLKDYDTFYIPRVKKSVEWALRTFIHNFQDNKKELLKCCVLLLGEVLEKYYEAFRKISPQLHLFEDLAEFPNSYNVEEIRAWDQRLSRSSKVSLNRYLGAIGSSREELILAFSERNESVRNNIQDRIVRSTNRIISEFNRSYLKGSAEIALNVKFDGSHLKFTVSNADMTGSVLWDEASSGVRWYLSAFFELKRALRSRNSIILIDEPAIHLHVSAQREARTLLQQLAQGTKYVLYTTHSPYLIDKNRLGDVQAIVREGDVSVVRNLTAIEDVQSRMEVLTPVCHALGYDMSMSLMPQTSRMNLVVEGITDSYYVNAMLTFLKVPDKDRPFVIPCQGAQSVPNVLSILLGWGLQFSVLLDNDEEGLSVSKKIDAAFGETGFRACMVSCERDSQTESLLSKGDYSKVCGKEFDPSDITKSKTVKAKRFAAMVESGELIPDETTIKNFKRVFDWLGILTWEDSCDDEPEWANKVHGKA